MFDLLSQALIDLAVSVITIFPQSPFRPLIAQLQASRLIDLFGYLNWLLPLGVVSKIFISWLAAIAITLVYQVILRWVKVIK